MSDFLLNGVTEESVFQALLGATPRDEVEDLVSRMDSLNELLQRVRARHQMPLRCIALGAVATHQLARPTQESFHLYRKLDDRTLNALRAWIEHQGDGLPQVKPDITPVKLAKILHDVHRAFDLDPAGSEITLVGAALAYDLVGVEQWESMRGSTR
ncbi:hypothetical protein ACFRR6_01395 [Streptomyces sp. NPDC056891]|uniref:hypothetical protein n=1 Tax=Streptomyces sp. NPDC056891 TaxID=3345961 RepID=UPI0036AAC3D8